MNELDWRQKKERRGAQERSGEVKKRKERMKQKECEKESWKEDKKRRQTAPFYNPLHPVCVCV